ncbi:MAG: alpha/beta fold hydrolase [Polyangiaceae bacterium]|nr:alpha/beta fold hydrolase [Polyangiaceae bacterium]
MPDLPLIGSILAATVVAYAAGVALFVLVTHAHLVWHRGVGRPGVLLRQMLVEAGWALVVQPMMPACYFVGRKVGAGKGGTPIVFIHGYGHNRCAFVFLARRLRGAHVGAMYGFNYSWLRSLHDIARSLEVFIDEVKAETGASRVDLVCHSMGGLVAMQLLSDERGLSRTRRFATIAAPHGGVAYRGPIAGRAARELRNGHGLQALPALPMMSVYSDGDNIVFPKQSSHLDSPRAENLELTGVGHLGVLYSPDTVRSLTRFLEAAD